ATQPTHETRTFFTYPDLHAAIVSALLPDLSSARFHKNHDDHAFEHEWPTHVMGAFTCTNARCKNKRWTSKEVTIEIHGYTRNGYSTVVFYQRCKLCNRLGTFAVDKESYVERVAYRIKKWAGVNMALSFYNSKVGPPHEQEFCEGCKVGKCREGDKNAGYE
ncbi:hypothetical protein EK21DRAFT_40365, partial [Setomelanomma holmii]